MEIENSILFDATFVKVFEGIVFSNSSMINISIFSFLAPLAKGQQAIIMALCPSVCLFVHP